jgi:carbamoyltransferase
LEFVNEGRETLGLYAIQDRIDTEYPQMVHDHSLAVMSNGKVKNFLQLERFSRVKRDNKLHVHLPELLMKLGLVDVDMDVVFVDNMVGRAMISANGQVRFEAPLAARLTKDCEKGRLWWFNRALDGYVLSHELAHVFSAVPFYGMFKENSLMVHFDGGASMSNFSAWMYKNEKIIPVEHHWELKHLTSLFNANALVYGIIGASAQDKYSVPGKLMGYAALGNYTEEIEFWLRQNNWFRDISGQPSIFFDRVKSDFNIDLKIFDQHNRFLQDVAATIQELFMRETLLKLDDLHTLSGCKTMYYTGGSALNIHTNSSIVESGIFDHVYIPPCTDDSGLALGAAAFGEWKKGHKFQLHHPYLNSAFELENEVEVADSEVRQLAQLLSEGNVVGVCNGKGEAGPRALGNRSLLALPTKALSHKVSVVHKSREWYRPVAPIMLEKNVKYYTGQATVHPLSRYMLIDLPIVAGLQSEIAGVVHANGGARIQTLFSREDNPLMWDLLTILDEHYGVKALINTSFNAPGEPIVHTAAEARRSAKLMQIDALLVEGKVEFI